MKNQIARIETEIDALTISGEGKRSPRILRPILGDTHTFRVEPTALETWLRFSHPMLMSLGNCEAGTLTVATKQPSFIKRLLPYIDLGQREVHVTTTVQTHEPIGLFYNLYLPINGEPYHTEQMIPGFAHHLGNRDLTEYDLISMLELLKSAQPFKK